MDLTNPPLFLPNSDYYGGTEYMLSLVNQDLGNLMPKMRNYLTHAAPGMSPHVYDRLSKPTILWSHNTPIQFGKGFEEDIRYITFPNLKYLIVPSEFSKKKYLEFAKNINVELNPEQVVVIPNAIFPLNYNEQKWQFMKPIKFIYVSDSGRGLELLLQAFTKWKRDDVRLEIFTSANPHIRGFVPHESPSQFLLSSLKNDNRIRMYGTTNKYTLSRHFSESHAFVYPCIYEETSCISLMEALSAGLLCRTTNVGALKETGKTHVKTFEFTKTLKNLIKEDISTGAISSYRNLYEEDYWKNVEIVKEQLEKTYTDFSYSLHNPLNQINFVNTNYHWKRVRELWLEFHEQLPEHP